MELIGTAWNYVFPLYPIYMESVPKSSKGFVKLYAFLVFQNKNVGMSFVFQNKDESSFNSIV